MTIHPHLQLSMLDAASLYSSDHHWHVIPVWRINADASCRCPRGRDCLSPGKHPAIDSWQTAASTDYAVLKDWFSDDRHNLGVVCGPSKILVIDVDPRNGGFDSMATLSAELGALPPTVTQDTGGGGKHYLFKRPDGDLVGKLGPGIDLLRDSRQFLVEPSVHASGNLYAWQPGHAPDDVAIAALPDAWLCKALKPKPPRMPRTMPTMPTDLKVERARRYLAKIPGAVSGDGGHTATFNAVAHVMIGFDLDAESTYSLIASEYNPRCDPEWSEREIHHKIRSVAERCERTRGYLLDADRRPIYTTEQAADSAPPPTDDPTADEIPWSSRLQANDKGKAKRGYYNVLQFVRWHPDYVGRWSLNAMTGEVWFDGGPIAETFVHVVRAHIDERLNFSPSAQDVEAAIASCAADRPFHPIQQYLRSVDWDGTERLASIARDYLSSDSALHADLARKWMISAVARALRPGCKVDTALMLYGEQGYFKSSFFAVLGGAWHSDSAIDISSKDSFQQIHSAWIYEFAELENVVTGRAESRLKAWLTSTHDTFRAPYARAVARRARSCVIAGTTNRQQFLTDETGSRRFWIVPVSKPIDRELLASCRDQLWAEAVAAYEAGEPWWLERDADAAREKANEEFVEDDPWTQAVADWLASPVITEISTAMIMRDALKLDAPRQDRAAQVRVGRIMRRLRWSRVRMRDGFNLFWVYRRCSL
jgi:hypothetical protein